MSALPAATASDDFARKVARLHAAQRDGQAPPPGDISRAELGAWLGLSEAKVRRLEALAAAKFLHRLKAAGVNGADVL